MKTLPKATFQAKAKITKPPQALLFTGPYLALMSRYQKQGDSDGRGQQTASPMFTANMGGGVWISGRELSTQLINSLEQANHSFS